MEVVMLAVRLPAALENELTVLAQETGRSKSFFVVEALKRYLEEMSDRFELEKAINEFYEGDRRTYTSAEVARELGIEL
jgi:RHH-type rel operon transcriptional repressor/antitoxin RelB